MPQIICTLPNASELISGVKFMEHQLGKLSEEVSEEVAAFFTSIPGYVLHEVKAAVIEPTKEELLARAAKVGLAVKNNWGLARLKAEVEGAEEDAAETKTAPTETQAAEVPSSVAVSVSPESTDQSGAQ